MGILEKIFDMVVQFLTEQKKTNELLEQIKIQTSIKSDFLIHGQDQAILILECSTPTLKKYIDNNTLELYKDYIKKGKSQYIFSLSSLLILKGQICKKTDH